ncbi:MAG: hypothetical protein JRJ49_03415 [Deltaproteobacteria bacterium]|nr:hypothetical protein [Deltaproteobacteria bacterium]
MKQTIIKKTASGLEVKFEVGSESGVISLAFQLNGKKHTGYCFVNAKLEYLKEQNIKILKIKLDQEMNGEKSAGLTISESDFDIVKRAYYRIIAEKKEAEKAESEKREAFLKLKGYNCKLVCNYDETADEQTDLAGQRLSKEDLQSYRYFKNGKMVKEYEKELLIKEGYFGEQVKAEKAQAKEEAKKIAAEKESLKKEIETSFEKAEKPEKTGGNFIKLEIGNIYCDNSDIYGCGGYYFIDEKKAAIWRVNHNGMDGDDWRHNNIKTGGAGAIGIRLPYSETLAKKIIKLNELIKK